MKTYTDAEMLSMICLALEEGVAGIKHTEDLNVLLVKMIGEHWGRTQDEATQDEVEAAFKELEPYIPARPVAVAEHSTSERDG